MTDIKRVLYTAEATADFGRNGWVRTSDGTLEVALAKPVGMGGQEDAQGTNPEQLFAAGYAACFHGALLYQAKAEGVDATASTVTASVAIGTVDVGGLGLAVDLVVDLPDIEPAMAQKLVEAAHDTCPYSRATRGNIAVNYSLRQ